MPCVLARLEADVVGPEQPAQDLLAGGQQPVDLRRWKRDVQEEADGEVRPAGAQHRRHEHEVEVVHPHPCRRAGLREDRVREPLVDLDVSPPRLLGDPQAVGEVVEQRPQRVVADPSVEVVDLVRAQEDGVETVLREPCGHLLAGAPRARAHQASRPTRAPGTPWSEETSPPALGSKRGSPDSSTRRTGSRLLAITTSCFRTPRASRRASGSLLRASNVVDTTIVIAS